MVTNLLERQTESLSRSGGRPQWYYGETYCAMTTNEFHLTILVLIIGPVNICKTHGKCMCFGGRGLVPMGTLFLHHTWGQ